MGLSFEVSGGGAVPLVCLHGWACSGAQFGELSKRLAQEFRVFRPDLPGHGRTPLDDFVPGFAAYAQTVVDFVLEHGLERPVLCGHSLGGVLALMAAASPRLQPAAVINLDGSLPATEAALIGQRRICDWLDEPDFRARLARLLARVFFLPTERDARREAIIQTMCAAPEPVLRFLPEQVDEPRPEQILPRIEAPVLFVGSGFPRFDSEYAAALIPGLRVERLSGTGHFLHVYAADRVARLIGNFAGPHGQRSNRPPAGRKFPGSNDSDSEIR